MHLSLFNHSLTEGRSGCLQLGAIMNKAALNLYMHFVHLLCVYSCEKIHFYFSDIKKGRNWRITFKSKTIHHLPHPKDFAAPCLWHSRASKGNAITGLFKFFGSNHQTLAELSRVACFSDFELSVLNILRTRCLETDSKLGVESSDLSHTEEFHVPARLTLVVGNRFVFD